MGEGGGRKEGGMRGGGKEGGEGGKEGGREGGSNEYNNMSHAERMVNWPREGGRQQTGEEGKGGRGHRAYVSHAEGRVD